MRISISLTIFNNTKHRVNIINWESRMISPTYFLLLFKLVYDLNLSIEVKIEIIKNEIAYT